MRLLILSAAVSAALALSACSMAPKLVKPELPVPTAYTTAVAADQHANAADLGWRSMFGDRRLQRLIGSRSRTTATCACRAECPGCRSAVRHPAFRAPAVDRCRREFHAPAHGRRLAIEPAAAREHAEPVRREHRSQRVRDRPVRPREVAVGCGVRALPRDRSRPPGSADRARRLRGQRVFRRASRRSSARCPNAR